MVCKVLGHLRHPPAPTPLPIWVGAPAHFLGGTYAGRPGLGHCNLVKNLVKTLVINLVINLVKTHVFLEAEALTRNLGFLEDEDPRILGKCIGDH